MATSILLFRFRAFVWASIILAISKTYSTLRCSCKESQNQRPSLRGRPVAERERMRGSDGLRPFSFSISRSKTTDDLATSFKRVEAPARRIADSESEKVPRAKSIPSHRSGDVIDPSAHGIASAQQLQIEMPRPPGMHKHFLSVSDHHAGNQIASSVSPTFQTSRLGSWRQALRELRISGRAQSEAQSLSIEHNSEHKPIVRSSLKTPQ
jgi:hypothetical protein